jgi:hypothetical protein
MNDSPGIRAQTDARDRALARMRRLRGLTAAFAVTLALVFTGLAWSSTSASSDHHTSTSAGSDRRTTTDGSSNAPSAASGSQQPTVVSGGS